MKNSFYALALAGLLIGGCASPDATDGGASEKSLPKRAEDRASDIDVDSNINQINQSLMMIKQDSGAPATLDEAKRAVKVPDEMWMDSVSGKPLVYDAASGTVHREGVAAGGPPTAGANPKPGGINIPAMPAGGAQ